MSILVDEKFVRLVSGYLTGFREVARRVYNFRCPLCGDSTSDKAKQRGYIYHNHGKDYLSFKCHRCGESLKFATLIRKVAPKNISQEYIACKIRGQRTAYPDNKSALDPIPLTKPIIDTAKYINIESFAGYQRLSNKNRDNPAYTYLRRRGIPEYCIDRFGYTPTFKSMTNFFIPNKFSKIDPDFECLIIPLTTKQGRVFGYQGRRLSDRDKRYRYTSIVVDKGLKARTFGLNRIDVSERVYVVEGPIDTCFLPNSIASCGSDLRGLDEASDIVFVFDCEPRKKEIVDIIERKLRAGASVALLPSKYFSLDINDIALKFRMTPERIKTLVDEHVAHGLKGIITFNNWKRV